MLTLCCLIGAQKAYADTATEKGSNYAVFKPNNIRLDKDNKFYAYGDRYECTLWCKSKGLHLYYGDWDIDNMYYAGHGVGDYKYSDWNYVANVFLIAEEDLHSGSHLYICGYYGTEIIGGVDAEFSVSAHSADGTIVAKGTAKHHEIFDGYGIEEVSETDHDLGFYPFWHAYNFIEDGGYFTIDQIKVID